MCHCWHTCNCCRLAGVSVLTPSPYLCQVLATGWNFLLVLSYSRCRNSGKFLVLKYFRTLECVRKLNARNILTTDYYVRRHPHGFCNTNVRYTIRGYTWLPTLLLPIRWQWTWTHYLLGWLPPYTKLLGTVGLAISLEAVRRNRFPLQPKSRAVVELI